MKTLSAAMLLCWILALPTTHSSSRTDESVQKQTTSPTGFTLLRMSNSVKDDGAPSSSNMYEAVADKQKVWLDFFYYDTSEDVKNAFDTQVKKATKIIERGNR